MLLKNSNEFSSSSPTHGMLSLTVRVVIETWKSTTNAWILRTIVWNICSVTFKLLLLLSVLQKIIKMKRNADAQNKYQTKSRIKRRNKYYPLKKYSFWFSSYIRHSFIRSYLYRVSQDDWTNKITVVLLNICFSSLFFNDYNRYYCATIKRMNRFFLSRKQNMNILN